MKDSCFSALKGKGVKVALIDSGINPFHSHVMGVEAGVRLGLGPGGEIFLDGDYRDFLGHGTALAGIMRKKAPLARLYAVKVFEKGLTTYPSLILKGMEWALEKGVNLINLSLGAFSQEPVKEWEELLEETRRRKVIVVASASRGEERLYPASWPSVISVKMDENCGWDDYVYYGSGAEAEFGACGHPRPLPSMSQRQNLQGDSFASAHLTGFIAIILERFPEADVEQVRETLISLK